MPEIPNVPENPAPTARREGWSRAEIDAAIAGLDRATRAFSERVNAMRSRTATPAPSAGTGDGSAAPGQTAPPPVTPRAPDDGPLIGEREPLAEPTARQEAQPRSFAAEDRADRVPAGADAEAAFERRMEEAERQARQYLDRAKRRVDSLVETMIGSVEREAAQIRDEAEAGIRERWRHVELEANRYLEDARRVGDGMVAERQQRIGALSDQIVDRAEALTTGMEDAERIRRQFDSFIRALSETAGRIAEESPGRVASEITRLQERRSRPERAAA